MIAYKDAKILAADSDAAVRRGLAERPDTQPEILYFLAEDERVEVRQAIAMNNAAPRQADLILAKDADIDVRERLAHKIGRLAPDMSQDQRDHISELTLDVIAILANDRATRIRQIIAEALKDLAHVPADIVARLARDVEIQVAGPVLECSPLLSDSELIEIIESKPIQGALTAIARRRRLGMKLADSLVVAAVTAPEGVMAVAALLKNNEAEIDGRTLDRILDLAPDRKAWHEPLVRRTLLPPMAFRRLAGFISLALLDVLQKRGDADPKTMQAVTETVRRRLAETEVGGEPTPNTSAEPKSPDRDDEEEACMPPVGEAAIHAAIAACAMSPVAAALARDSGLPRAVVRKILASASAKAIVALAWKAGYAMPIAVTLQTAIGKIPPEHALQPRVDDSGFPLSESELEWQIELFPTPSTGTKLSRVSA